MSQLVDLRNRPPEERQAIARKGGLARSDAKTLANMTKGLKHGRYAKGITRTVEELASDPNRSALKIYQLIDRLEAASGSLPPRLQMDLVRLLCEAHRTIHGTKQTNLSITAELKQDLEAWFYESPQ